jgi:adenylate cyclase
MTSHSEKEALFSDGSTEPRRGDVEKIRAALETLLADRQFHASERNRHFLRFVTEEALSGRAERIKSYTIAVDVFGRPADFDGKLDPIVRIEATRLRAALAAYYEGPGSNEAIKIRLPKGGYVPSFERTQSPPHFIDDAPKVVAENPAPAQIQSRQPRYVIVLSLLALLLLVALAAPTWINRTAVPQLTPSAAILVDVSQAATAGTESAEIGTGFAQALTLTLSRFDQLRVFSVSPGMSLPAASDKLKANAAGAIYALETSVRKDDRSIHFWWRLTDARTGETIWSDVADPELAKGLTVPVEYEVANRISTVIGQPQGLVTARETGVDRNFPTAGYGCVLRARAYYLTISEKLHREVRDCLEQTVAIAPDYADAWAVLSFVYLDEDRENFNRRSTAEDALNRAITSAKRAAELAPASALAQEALMVVYYRKGDFDTAFDAGRRALQINPRDPELLSELGQRMFARGQWDEGAKLVRDANNRMLVVPPLDRVTLVLDSYRKGDYSAALEQVELIDLPKFYGAFLLRAAIYGELRNMPEAQKNIEALLELRPNYAAEMRPELRSRHYTEPMIDMLAGGLKKAGLDVQ